MAGRTELNAVQESEVIRSKRMRVEAAWCNDCPFLDWLGKNFNRAEPVIFYLAGHVKAA